MKRILKSERGIALFLVLWVMALLTVIAGEFCHTIRADVNVTRNFKEETQAYYIAMSGLFWAVGELVVNELAPRQAKIPGSEEGQEDIRRPINSDLPAIPFGEGQFKVEQVNESGKVNLNRAGAPLLKMMLNYFQIEDANKSIIVDSIMDWRDKDNLHRLNGAEDDYYLSLPQPYKCKNGDFTSIEELLLVRGVTPEIFHGGLKDMVAVYQDKETVSVSDSRKGSVSDSRKGSVSDNRKGSVSDNRKGSVSDSRKGSASDSKKGSASSNKTGSGFDFNRININAASPRMLRALPRMTEDIVQAIVKYREQKDFRSLTDLHPVVGSEVYAAISPHITLSLSPYYTIKSVGTLKEGKTRQGVQAVVKIDKSLKKGYEVIQWIDGLEYRS